MMWVLIPAPMPRKATGWALSYRRTSKLAQWINAGGNISFSKNKIKNFTEYVDDYDNGGQKVYQYQNTDISFSPDVVASGALNIIPLLNGEISLQSKYVGQAISR